MNILRVQHLRGHGPFTGKPHVSSLLHSHPLKRHIRHPSEGPAPWRDIPAFIEFEKWRDKRFNDDTYIAKEPFYCPWRFGCLSLPQILEWFDLEVRHILQWHGYRLFEFAVHESYVLLGRTQCAFIPQMATRTRVLNLEKLS